MKKAVFAAALAACICCAGVTPLALLRRLEPPQPSQPSSAGGSQLYPDSSEPARFLPVNSQYNTAADYLYLSFTNQEAAPVALTGQASLEIEGEWKQYLQMPRHDTAAASAAESGLLPEAAGRSVAPGETLLFQMYVGHYKPVHVSGSVLPFLEGRYRVAAEARREDGSVFEWACLPFRIVAGSVQADQSNVAVSVGRAAYSPRTTLIRYTIENHTSGDIWHDGSARLQKLSGGARWTDAAETPAGELRQLAPGASDAGEIAVPDGLSAGTCRVVKAAAGLDLTSGQFTVPGSEALRLGITPVQVSVDWYAKAEQDRVKRGYWTRTQAGRDLWLTADDLYDGQSAPEALLRELESFQPGEEPVGYSRDKVAELTFWDAGDGNVTVSLMTAPSGTYCLAGDKWYKSGDSHVLDRIGAALDAKSGI